MKTQESGSRLSRIVAACAIAVGATAIAPTVQARITKIVIEGVESPANNGQVFGSVGVYDRVFGSAYGELNPNDPHNGIITDLQFAPRNAKGMVEYNMTFSMRKPNDMAKASASCSTRSSIAATARRRAAADGHVSLVAGWQGDVTPTATNQTMQLPIAEESPTARASAVPFVTRWMAVSGNTQQIIMPRNEVTRYPPTTMDTREIHVQRDLVGNRGRRAGRRRAHRAGRLGLRRLPHGSVPRHAGPDNACA